MLKLTPDQLQAVAYHSTQLRRLRESARYITDVRQRVNLSAPTPRPDHDDPLGQGMFVDVVLPASTIRATVKRSIKRHRDALAALGITVVE